MTKNKDDTDAKLVGTEQSTTWQLFDKGNDYSLEIKSATIHQNTIYNLPPP